MKIYYDKETDSAYIELSQVQPSGTIEISGGANINTTNAGEVVCIELLNAPAEFPIGTLFKFEVDPSLMVTQTQPPPGELSHFNKM